MTCMAQVCETTYSNILWRFTVAPGLFPENGSGFISKHTVGGLVR